MRFMLPFLALGAALPVTAALAASAADVTLARGQALYEAQCSACHSVDAHRVGPSHRGVLGRRAGSAAGFAYTPALAASTLVWTRESLARWLADPEAVIPGQGMGYRVNAEADRAAIVEYLASLKR